MNRMPQLRWTAMWIPRDELGGVVHGPVVLARSPGITAALRHVIAHPSGLALTLVLRAEGVQAEAAGRHRRHRVRHFPMDDAGSDPWSGPLMTVTVDEEERRTDAGSGRSSSSADDYDSEAVHWIGRLPTDGRLRITIAWPQAGLAEATTDLQLDDLSDLADRVVRLP
jgi:hypothetical protein